MEINTKKVLFFIFLIVLVARLYFVFQTPYFHDSAYEDKRYIEYIVETGKPIFFDQLSYNGKDVIYSPVYHYTMAFFVSIFGESAFKLLPSLAISLLVFVLYKIAYHVSKKEEISLFVALGGGFIPIIFAETLNKISIYTFVLPLVFYLTYLLMNLSRKNIGGYVFFTFLLALLHPIALLFLAALIIYVLILNTENLELAKMEKEAITFSIFLILLIEFFIYKRAFLEHGISVIWNNVPLQVLGSYFDLNLFNAVYQIGIFTTIFGFAGLVLGFIRKRKTALLYGSIVLSNILLMWLRLVNYKIALMFLGISLIVLSAIALKEFKLYLEKTKLSKNFGNYFYYGVLILFSASLLVPSFIEANDGLKEIPSDYEILVLEWIKDNALPDVTVLAPVEKGYVISGFSGKRTVIDPNYLLIENPSEIYEDVETIYSTKSEVIALGLISKYNIDYIFMPVEIETRYGKVTWLDDTNCFEEIFIGNPKLYRVTC